MNKHLQKLIETALFTGASAVHVLRPKELVIDEKLAEYCQNPRCENYGLSASCPPHVQGPSALQQWRNEAKHALAIKIDVPSNALFSAEKYEVMRLLHEVVAAVESEARNFTYVNSRGFAGGSCKKIFCSDHPQCLRLSEEGTCRHPLHARPSMSGFGVNVAEMMKAAGWHDTIIKEKTFNDNSMSWVAGLVLIAK